jgi:hypothetical protein
MADETNTKERRSTLILGIGFEFVNLVYEWQKAVQVVRVASLATPTKKEVIKLF